MAVQKSKYVFIFLPWHLFLEVEGQILAVVSLATLLGLACCSWDGMEMQTGLILPQKKMPD